MRNNLEKYNVLLSELWNNEFEFLQTMPQIKELYHIVGRYTGTIETKPILKIIYRSEFCAVKKPTKKDIQKLKDFLVANKPFDKNKVLYCTQKYQGQFMGGISLYEIDGENCWYGTNKEQMQARALEYKEIYEPKDGHAPCARCGRQRKPEDLIEGRIIGMNWKDSPGCASPVMKFCKDRPCYGEEQMANEG